MLLKVSSSFVLSLAFLENMVVLMQLLKLNLEIVMLLSCFTLKQCCLLYLEKDHMDLKSRALLVF